MKGSRITLWAVGWWLCLFFAWTLVSAAEEELPKEDIDIRSGYKPLRSGYEERIGLRIGRADHRIEKRSRSRNAMLRLGRAKSQDIYLRYGRGGGGGRDDGEIYTDARVNEENNPFEVPRVPKAAQDMYLRLGRARMPESFRHQQTYLRLGRAGDAGLLGSWAAEPVAEDPQPLETDDEYARLSQPKIF